MTQPSEKDAARPDQVTFVIATYNRRSVLEATVSQILALAEQAEVIIIDDGSGDGTGAFLASRLGNYPRLRLLTNERNRGSAYCWNLGIQNTRTPYLVFLPDDALELLPTVEEFARTVCTSLRYYDIVGPHVAEPNVFPMMLRGTLRDIVTTTIYAISGQVIATNDGVLRSASFVTGVMAIRREVGISVLFDSDLMTGNGYREESDFQLRARRLGCRILYHPTACVLHSPARSGGQIESFKKRGYAFWALRNQMLFMAKNELTMWQARYAFFVIYQIIVHHASLKVIGDATREAMDALQESSTPMR
jgi:GT2 family glycosyltransferase